MKYWLVDAFTDKPFRGNPTPIFLLNRPLHDELMQNIAKEMNFTVVVFLVLEEKKKPFLRWFSRNNETDLCGHGTLATAHIYLNDIYPELKEVTFTTKFVGPLQVRQNELKYTIDLPTRQSNRVDLANIPDFVLNALSDKKPREAFQPRDLILVYENEQTIYKMKPDFNALSKYNNDITVTAISSKKYDFISRFFYVKESCGEDPVTGSSHCSLAPYWSQRLRKKHLKAHQASKRGGELIINLDNNRVHITGQAVTVLEGYINPSGLHPEHRSLEHS